uniref:MD-2-related lipid-recognition domain-containing protein n=1 Tax=Arion vulgaris TaxID=1028688 RepID=A0A0B6YQX3_9EUPU
MNSLLVVLALCAVVTVSFAQKVAFHDCGSKLSVVNEVDVVPCTALPCPFKKGTNVTVSINLTPNTAVSDARTVVHGIIAGVPVLFPLPDGNACNFMKCPLVAGTPVVYTTSIFVDPHYPSLTVVVQWELTSTLGEIVCFSLPVTISD